MAAELREYKAPISASAVLAEDVAYPGRYKPRIIHIAKETVWKLIGRASHHAWRELARQYKMIRLKGKFSEHKAMTGKLMRAWCWELVEGML